MITDEIATPYWNAIRKRHGLQPLTTEQFQRLYPEERREEDRAALSAVAPMIREQCAKVAESAYYQQCCGRGYYECCGDAIMAAEEPTAIAAAIRAMKGVTHE